MNGACLKIQGKSVARETISAEKDYAALMRNLISWGGFIEAKQKKIVSSQEEAKDLLYKIRQNFQDGLDPRNKMRRAILKWAFREYLGEVIVFSSESKEA